MTFCEVVWWVNQKPQTFTRWRSAVSVQSSPCALCQGSVTAGFLWFSVSLSLVPGPGAIQWPSVPNDMIFILVLKPVLPSSDGCGLVYFPFFAFNFSMSLDFLDDFLVNTTEWDSVNAVCQILLLTDRPDALMPIEVDVPYCPVLLVSCCVCVCLCALVGFLLLDFLL